VAVTAAWLDLFLVFPRGDARRLPVYFIASPTSSGNSVLVIPSFLSLSLLLFCFFCVLLLVFFPSFFVHPPAFVLPERLKKIILSHAEVGCAGPDLPGT